jgi:hypothetical protein
MTNIIFTRIKDENILPQFEGRLVEVDEASERNCGTEEDHAISYEITMLQECTSQHR